MSMMEQKQQETEEDNGDSKSYNIDSSNGDQYEFQANKHHKKSQNESSIKQLTLRQRANTMVNDERSVSKNDSNNMVSEIKSIIVKEFDLL